MVPRIPSWTKGVAVAVLPVPPRPFVDKRCCSCSSPCPSVALRGQKVLQLQFSVVLRGPSPSWTKGVAVAVLRGPPSLRGRWPFVDKRCCSSPCPSVLRGQKVLQLQFSVALRGQKGVAVLRAVLRVLRGPSWTKVLQLQFSVSLRSPCCSCLRVPPWPFVDKRCCSCSSPCPSVALRGQKRCCSCSSPWSLRGPSWTKGVLRGQKVLQCQFSVGPSWTKGVAVAVLRVPPWPFVDKRCCSSAVLRVPSWTKNRSPCPPCS